jgi:small subunit ribosomal protein S9
VTLPSDPYVWGTGRRKTAVARVRMKAGSGQFTINGRAVSEFFTTPATLTVATKPLVVTETANRYDIWVRVGGGGITGQAGAVCLGVARALKRDAPTLEPLLRENHLLTRDPRMIERKKYGLRKARRATQFSKR